MAYRRTEQFTHPGLSIEELDNVIPHQAKEWIAADAQRSIPKIAKDQAVIAAIENGVKKAASEHTLHLGDSRQMPSLPDSSVQLVVTSPPYWNLKDYDGNNDSQLGDVQDYEKFLDSIDRVWEEAYRVLEPGGRLVIIVGDVCLSRRQYGRHIVFPLHASIQERCRHLGFDNLSPIIWYKIANARFESGGGGFLGKPYEPNAVIKNDVEYILFQRKPGGYRNPTQNQRLLSVISRSNHQKWFQQVWRLTGASTAHHPAPFPLELAERLIRMFSFVGDTVLDPFMGSGSTNVAALRWGRHSVGFEVEEKYFNATAKRLADVQAPQLAML